MRMGGQQTTVGSRSLFLAKPFWYGTALIIGLLLWATVDSRVVMSLMSQSLIFGFLALGVGFLLRLGGLVSFGHAAPFGMAGYCIAIALKHVNIPAEVVIPLVILGVGLVSYLIGLVIMRIEGIAFAMLTLAIGQGVYVSSLKLRDVTGGADGMVANFPSTLYGIKMSFLQSPDGLFISALMVLLFVIALLDAFEHTHTGILAEAVRENEERAQFLGYKTLHVRALVYAISAMIAATGGGLYIIYQSFIAPEILHWSMSGSALIMAILGGSSAIWGPVSGAIVYFLFRDWLGDMTEHWLGILGGSLIAVMFFWPGGISHGAEKLREKLSSQTRGGQQ